MKFMIEGNYLFKTSPCRNLQVFFDHIHIPFAPNTAPAKRQKQNNREQCYQKSFDARFNAYKKTCSWIKLLI